MAKYPVKKRDVDVVIEAEKGEMCRRMKTGWDQCS